MPEPNDVAYRTIIQCLDGAGIQHQADTIYGEALERGALPRHYAASGGDSGACGTLDVRGVGRAVAATALRVTLAAMVAHAPRGAAVPEHVHDARCDLRVVCVGARSGEGGRAATERRRGSALQQALQSLLAGHGLRYNRDARGVLTVPAAALLSYAQQGGRGAVGV